MSPSGCCALLFATGAVVSDLREEKVDNLWIVLGYLAGFSLQIYESGIPGIGMFLGGAGALLLLLWPLFSFRMLGAGDIKVLSAAGGLLGAREGLACLFWALVFGAGLSVAILWMEKSAAERFTYFFRYVRQVIITGHRVPYRTAQGGTGRIHFTVPILMSILFRIGGSLP